MSMVLTLVAFSMMVAGSLVLDMQGYTDDYATEDDAHLH